MHNKLWTYIVPLVIVQTVHLKSQQGALQDPLYGISKVLCWSRTLRISCFYISVPFFVSAQELQKYEQFIFADYTSVIQVENVYEEILYQTLLEETLKGENIIEVTVITFWLLAGELLLQSFPES